MGRVTFEHAWSEARAGKLAGDRVIAALQSLPDVYSGELLADDGPAEWVITVRDRYQVIAADAAHTLAELERAGGWRVAQRRDGMQAGAAD